MERQTEGRTDQQTYRWKGKQMNGETDRGMDRPTDIQMDRTANEKKTDRRTNRHAYI
jgi:hypothetical protein